eukprot:s3780_g6.t1
MWRGSKSSDGNDHGDVFQDAFADEIQPAERRQKKRTRKRLPSVNPDADAEREIRVPHHHLERLVQAVRTLDAKKNELVVQEQIVASPPLPPQGTAASSTPWLEGEMDPPAEHPLLRREPVPHEHETRGMPPWMAPNGGLRHVLGTNFEQRHGHPNTPSTNPPVSEEGQGQGLSVFLGPDPD